MKEDINTYQIVKTPFRLMYLVMGFGPFLGPNLPKNEHFVIFLENGAYDFFLNFAQQKRALIPIKWRKPHLNWFISPGVMAQKGVNDVTGFKNTMGQAIL